MSGFRRANPPSPPFNLSIQVALYFAELVRIHSNNNDNECIHQHLVAWDYEQRECNSLVDDLLRERNTSHNEVICQKAVTHEVVIPAHHNDSVVLAPRDTTELRSTLLSTIIYLASTYYRV